jgi:hypothetical protein
MKNAQDIITSIQYKPQFKKILHYKCISKLMDTILPAIRRSVKHGYINKNTLYITITSALNKYDKDNIIKTIKTVLNSKMILQSERFVACNEINIEDVIVYVDHKPKMATNLYRTDVDKLTYFERASGDIEINIKDPKLNNLAQSIQDIIKKEKHDPS